MVPKVYQRENLLVCNILGVTLCIGCITILEIKKTGGGGHRIGACRTTKLCEN